jgi:hypothetical protein
VTALLVSIGVLIAAFMLQRSHPVLAGLMAVVPVKILGSAAIAYQRGPSVFKDVIGGMLVGQCVWALLLAVVWWRVR